VRLITCCLRQRREQEFLNKRQEAKLLIRIGLLLALVWFVEFYTLCHCFRMASPLDALFAI
jgi:hypothetical protein